MKNPTIKDIAKIANVSITTVSKALANHPDISKNTKSNVIRICNELNYVPNSIASNLRKNRTRLVGVIISDSTNPYYASFLKSVESELSLNKYYTIIFNANEDGERELAFINELRAMQVAGIIITPTSSKSIELLRDSNLPFVLAHRYIEKNLDNYIVADDEQAGYLASKAILENNNSKDVFFFGNKLNISSVRNRLNGYLKGLKENGIEPNMSNVYLDLYSNEDGYKAALKIIDKYTPPYSFVCYSDYIAVGVLKALYEKGIKVPEEVKVIGIDNIDLFTFAHPMLSTINIPKDVIGVKCVEVLRNMIAARKKGETIEDQQTILPTRLIRNNTC
ncbi:MAG: LacI family DNA-binding transcriptional regulator [Eubacteriales bacterium]|nr:LacI family DNA-binding transcriptional regulator [Eubacteriales bacterium]